jgi:hypothetical protein
MPLLPLSSEEKRRHEEPYSTSPYSSSYPSTSSSVYHSYPPSQPEAPKDYEMDPPPQSSSNTYHMTQHGHSNWDLPSGWKIAHRETDGRMYYFELGTGKTSWNHPLAGQDVVRNQAGGVGLETPYNASRRPDSHQCCAVFSCFVFPPLGIFALIHSIMTYRTWSQGKYGDSYDHSKQAYNFSWWAVAIFLGFVFYQYFVIGPGWATVKGIFSFDWLG